MDTKQVAAALNTEPKLLRRFLRADSNYANAGAGGRYAFTDDDVADMRERFSAWVGNKTTKPKSRPRSTSRSDDKLPTSILGRKLYASERTRVEAIARARVDRLEAALLEKGLHISQMKGLASR
jgi:hypothetical protein